MPLVRLEEQGAERRTKRQCIDGGDNDGDSHRDAELSVEGTTDPRDERHGYEDGSHDEGDGDDRSRDLVHSVHTSRVGGVIAFI